MQDYWAVGIIGYAFSCPSTFGLGLLCLFGILSFLWVWGRRPVSGAAALVIPSSVVAVAAWVFRDKQNILGDAMLWLDWSRAYGLSMPTYNEFLGTRLFGLVGEVTQNRAVLKTVFGLLSILSGLVCAMSIRGVLVQGEKQTPVCFRDAKALGLALVLIFLQPMSFVFFGHIESYPVFAATCSVFLVQFHMYLKTGQQLKLTILALLVAIACHTMGFLLCVPLVGVMLYRHRQPLRVVLLTCTGLVVLGIIVVVSVPQLRSFTVLQGKWSHHFSPAYLTGLLNAWFMLLLTPLLILASLGRMVRPQNSFEWFLSAACCIYMLLPLGVTWTLGFYSDLDLLTPAFVLGCFYVSLKVWTPHETRNPLRAVTMIPGMTILAAWLTVSQCPAGLRMFEEQARTGALTGAGRVYAFEEAAYFRRTCGDRTGALAILHEAIELSPGSMRLWGPIGDLQLALGDTTAAIGSYERLWTIPGRGQYMARFAQGLIENGNARRAVSVLQPHIKHVLRDGGQAAALAVAYMRLGRPDTTLLVSQQRAAIEPDDDVAHFNQGAALLRLGRAMEAMEQLRVAAKLSPTNIRYHLTLIDLIETMSGAGAARDYIAHLPNPIRDSVFAKLRGPYVTEHP